ncbi:hypothetical protein TREES_T100021077 [Tupaia chinensis]|uniref:Uncharacterized protein n=1 Tax=Tupaia chinensis TaxID=246437 RepID=L9JA49_TUPCH|nr:hypothetical protein TREES_T100021077 [Tupaia chinensis]
MVTERQVCDAQTAAGVSECLAHDGPVGAQEGPCEEEADADCSRFSANMAADQSNLAIPKWAMDSCLPGPVTLSGMLVPLCTGVS